MDEMTRAVMEAMAAAFPPVETMSGAAARDAVKEYASRVPIESPPVGRVENLAAPRGDGQVPVRVYWPPDVPAPGPAIVYFHGGGFVLADVDMYDRSTRELCLIARVVVVSVEYRLAPEHPFPAAVEDADAAVRWTVEHADELGVDRARIGVGGDSAGGNLAAVVARRARDAGIALAHQLLIYPMLDPTSPGASHVENAEGYFHTEAAARWYWAQYLGGRTLAGDPNVNPIRAADLGGVAPATILVAELDPGRDDGDAYAAALAKAGVSVDLRRAEGMFHGFFGVASALPPAAAIRDAVYEAVGAALQR